LQLGTGFTPGLAGARLPSARTQPVLPMGLGYVEGNTHDYVRHGTTTLFAALDVANGQVISRVRAQHHHQEFLDFLRQIDKQTPPELDLHLIAAPAISSAFHAHLQLLAQPGEALVRPHHRVRSAAIRSPAVRELKQQIELFVQRYNADATPLQWVATADSILQKIERAAKRISATAN